MLHPRVILGILTATKLGYMKSYPIWLLVIYNMLANVR